MNPQLVKEVDQRLRDLGLPHKTRVKILLGDRFWQGERLLVQDTVIPADSDWDKEVHLKTVAFVEYNK